MLEFLLLAEVLAKLLKMVEVKGPIQRPLRKLERLFSSIYPQRDHILRFWSWWRWTDSNRWPPACKAGALPPELHPQKYRGFLIAAFGSFIQQSKIYNLKSKFGMVGLDGVEPSTSRLSGVRSNQAELQAPSILDLAMRIPDWSFLINSQIQNLKSKIQLSPSFIFKY